MKRLLLLVVLLLVLGSAVWAQNQANIGLGVILNIIPGFGVGSFVMGDTVGGLVGVIGEGVGLGLIVAGYLEYVGGSFDAIGSGNPTGLFESMGSGIFLILGGALVYTGVQIFEIIRPIVYGSRQNNRMGSGNGPDLILTSYHGAPGLALSFKL